MAHKDFEQGPCPPPGSGGASCRAPGEVLCLPLPGLKSQTEYGIKPISGQIMLLCHSLGPHLGKNCSSPSRVYRALPLESGAVATLPISAVWDAPSGPATISGPPPVVRLVRDLLCREDLFHPEVTLGANTLSWLWRCPQNSSILLLR